MAFTLEALPYGLEALEPHLSARTLDFHRNKHQQGYLNTLKTLTEGTSLQQETLEDLIPKAFKDPAQKAIFNNAAQVWNHSFYWNSLK
ncbi:MAG: superoxide dismutase, partial [Holosporales bacterium]